MMNRRVGASVCASVFILAGLVAGGCSSSSSRQSDFKLEFAGVTSHMLDGRPTFWASFKVVNTGSVSFTQHTLQIVTSKGGEPLYGGERGEISEGFFTKAGDMGPDLKTSLNPGDTGYVTVVLDLGEPTKPVSAWATLTLENPAVPDSSTIRNVSFTIVPPVSESATSS